MNAEVVVAILGVGGISAIVAAIVTGLFSKRKLGAEATEIITKAAAGVVVNLQSEIDRQVSLRQEQAKKYDITISELMGMHRQEMEDVRRVLQLHVAWDAIAIAKMGEFGIELPPAPPLLPPRQDTVFQTTTDDLDN